jgi:hypothetical protein
MKTNSDINVLGGLPDYNLIRIYIAGEADDKTSDQVQQQYTSIRTEKAFKRFIKSIDTSMNTFKTENLREMLQQRCISFDLDDTLLYLLFLNMSLNNELFAYMNENIYFPVLYSGRTTITADEVVACLKELKQTEPSLKEWSDSTINVTASKYLTLLKKIGLLFGSVKKQILHKNLTDKQFVLFLYWLMQAEDTTNMSDSKWMKYGFIEKDYFTERCLQHKFSKYVNVNYNGDILRIEPTISYKEIAHECE